MKSKDYFGPSMDPTPLHYCDTAEEAEPFFKKGLKGDEVCKGISAAIHSVDDFNLLKAFLEHGASANAGQPGATPLHTHTDVNFLSELLKHGADVNAKDLFGRTALHCCLNFDAVKLLVSYGADLNVLDEDGELPEDDYLDDVEGRAMKEYLINIRNQNRTDI